jgi:glycosyltransferase involved in cell wall biosynthesis
MNAARPLRICMLTTFYPPWSFGGDGIQVERLSSVLAARGHDVTVVHSREAYRALGGEPHDDVPDNGVRLVAIDAGMGKLSPTATYLTGRPLINRRKIERALDQPFDVLHFHNPSLLGGPALLRMGEGLRLYTLHEQWLVCPTHVLWKYRRRVCEKPDCVRCTLSYRRPPQPWRRTGLLERSVAELDALIAPSATTARLHERFAPLVRLERLDHFLPEPWPGAAPRGQRPYFLYAGRLEPIKGVDRLIDAFRSRKEELVIAGSGSLEDRLRRRAADLQNVRFVGWIEQPELADLYQGALGLVLPTLGHESFPLVVLEAFARRVPVIARRFGAQAELVEQSGGGLTYASGTELTTALDRLSADEGLRRELGKRGRTAYEKRWTPEVHLTGYFALIARIARERGAGDLAAAAEAAAQGAG